MIMLPEVLKQNLAGVAFCCIKYSLVDKVFFLLGHYLTL